jgi:type I restriction enzyme S subunit
MGTEAVPFSGLLEEVIDNRGKTCPTADVGIPLIATNCIRNELLYPTYETVRFVSQQTYSTWFRGHPKPGDIIFVNKATPGRVCMVPDPVDFCIAQDMVAVRANPKKVYPRYLFAALRSPIVQERIAQMHVGTLIPHFKKSDFDKLLIPVPSRKNQEFIGDIYFNLSAKVDLNQRMNATLEAMARALFKSWFVDFDPVRVRALGHESNLPAYVAELFSDSFVESEIGEIPAGWAVQPIGEVVQVLGGGTPSTDEISYWLDGEYPFCTPRDLSRLTSPVLLSTERNLTEDGVSKISSGQLPRGTVLLSSRAPIGYLAISGIPVSVNQGIIAMVCDQNLPSLYVLHWTRFNMDRILANANGSTFLEISKRNFRPIPALIPSAAVLAAFDGLVRPLYDRMSANLEQMGTLATIRDILLPKLISGELRL